MRVFIGRLYPCLPPSAFILVRIRWFSQIPLRRRDDTIRIDNFFERVLAVSNPADRGQIHFALVWRHVDGVDDVHDVFSSGFATGISVRAHDSTPFFAEGHVDDSSRIIDCGKFGRSLAARDSA